MLVKNQFNLEPGTYEHYKGGIYVVETIKTHKKENDVWVKMQDPEVIYRNLENQYEKSNGKDTWVQKSYGRPLSEFTGETNIAPKGEPPVMVKRFKRV